MAARSFGDDCVNHEDRIALVTAEFGGRDFIKPFPKVRGIDTFLYIDDQGIAESKSEALASWDRIIVPDYPAHNFTPRLRAKYFKLQIHRLDEVENYRWLVWADASLTFRRPVGLRNEVVRLAALPAYQRLALYPHGRRKSIREEYDFVQMRLAKGDDYFMQRYSRDRLTAQIAYYEHRGWGLDRLWWGGIWLIENNELIQRCWDAWWDQNLRYGIMDQISLPPMLDRYDLEPQVIRESDLLRHPTGNESPADNPRPKLRLRRI